MGLILKYAVGISIVALLVATQAEQAFFSADPPVPQAAPVAAAHRASGIVALQGDKDGHFRTPVQINGQFVDTVIDTGASIVALSAEDARKAGLHPPASAFTAPMQTANGVVKGARLRLGELRLQSILIRDVEAVVLPPGALHGTLLGMSFLRQLSNFEMNGRTLVLRQ